MRLRALVRGNVFEEEMVAAGLFLAMTVPFQDELPLSEAASVATWVTRVSVRSPKLPLKRRSVTGISVKEEIIAYLLCPPLKR